MVPMMAEMMAMMMNMMVTTADDKRLNQAEANNRKTVAAATAATQRNPAISQTMVLHPRCSDTGPAGPRWSTSELQRWTGRIPTVPVRRALEPVPAPPVRSQPVTIRDGLISARAAARHSGTQLQNNQADTIPARVRTDL